MFKLVIIFFLITLKALAQGNSADTLLTHRHVEFKVKSFVIPTVLIGYGFLSLGHKPIKDVDYDIRTNLTENKPEKFIFDDYLQYMPMTSVYALNLVGIKGEHDFWDRTLILGTATAIMAPTVYALKRSTGIQRPDGSSYNSLPSGHTATAFMGAEFMYQEYKDVSLWYGLSGYIMAAGTGFLRMHNNRHWLSDVAAGAGIGMMSTKLAYWVHPFLKEKLFKDKTDMSGIVMPYYDGQTYGLGLSMRF